MKPKRSWSMGRLHAYKPERSKVPTTAILGLIIIIMSILKAWLKSLAVLDVICLVSWSGCMIPPLFILKGELCVLIITEFIIIWIIKLQKSIVNCFHIYFASFFLSYVFVVIDIFFLWLFSLWTIFSPFVAKYSLNLVQVQKYHDLSSTQGMEIKSLLLRKSQFFYQ